MRNWKNWQKILAVLGFETIILFGCSSLVFLWLGADLAWIIPVSLGITLYGLFVASMVLLVLHLMNRRAYSQKSKAGENQEVHQKRSVEIDLPKAQAFDLCLEALETLNNIPYPLPENMRFTNWTMKLIHARIHMKIKETNLSTGSIEARLRGKNFGFLPEPWDTFIINFQIEEIDADTSRVSIESRPRLPTVMFDFGLDLHFVNQLALYLRRESQTDEDLEDLEESFGLKPEAREIPFVKTNF